MGGRDGLRSRRGCVGAGVGGEGGARGARLWRAGPPQCRGRGRLRSKQPADQGGKGVKGRRQVRLRGYTSGRGAGEARVEVGAPIDRACDEKS